MGHPVRLRAGESLPDAEKYSGDLGAPAFSLSGLPSIDPEAYKRLITHPGESVAAATFNALPVNPFPGLMAVPELFKKDGHFMDTAKQNYRDAADMKAQNPVAADIGAALPMAYSAARAPVSKMAGTISKMSAEIAAEDAAEKAAIQAANDRVAARYANSTPPPAMKRPPAQYYDKAVQPETLADQLAKEHFAANPQAEMAHQNALNRSGQVQQNVEDTINKYLDSPAYKNRNPLRDQYYTDVTNPDATNAMRRLLRP